MEDRLLLITVQMIPHGIADAGREIARITVANDGTGTAEIGNYTVVARERRPDEGVQRDVLRLHGWQRDRPVLEMLAAILHEILVDRADQGQSTDD